MAYGSGVVRTNPNLSILYIVLSITSGKVHNYLGMISTPGKVKTTMFGYISKTLEKADATSDGGVITYIATFKS